ncbi:MAG: sigma-70 family RNA polymerase sigma factor [Chloroflexota bacterium]|nr:sigma-70 family RNA polymerase sigma factor [Chloroflexota bacterium]
MEDAVTLPNMGAIPESDEVELVRRAPVDAGAFAELYRRYLPRVYRYVRARLRNSDEAADVTQHVFLKASEALPRYRDHGAPFAAWLFRIARNTAIDNERRRRVTVPWESLAEIPAPDDVEAGAIDHERYARLYALLRELSSDERELLALRFAGGLTSKEIASVVGASDAAVKKRLARTIQKLKERYGD